ncbi:hypothetical protein cyc_01549 [Cyclospora cayetanensis]|uniref:Uncharacterized protein n=1 Tax=Cyclospora cayetanensis TaxID=88456 RepID=A0A1D3CV04_9EIME|nr:hypothetical protein cyc_01549 [Cyclospora cayetanensis]
MSMGLAEFAVHKMWRFVLCHVDGEVLMQVGSGQHLASVLQWDDWHCSYVQVHVVELCTDGAHMLMPVCVGNIQLDDVDLAVRLRGIGNTVTVLKSALVLSFCFLCPQSCNVNSSSRTDYVSYAQMVYICSCQFALLIFRKWVVQAISEHVEEYAAHCTRSVFHPGAQISSSWLVERWRLAGVRAFRRLRHDEAELAGRLHAIGSTVPVVKSALVSSCRIACAQTNYFNSSHRTAYHSCFILCRGLVYGRCLEKCKNISSGLRVRYVGLVLSRIGASYDVEASVLLGDAFLQLDDSELAGPLRASGSPATLLKSALVSSCRIACVQSNNINSSDTTAYVSMKLCWIGGPYYVEA